MGELEH